MYHNSVTVSRFVSHVRCVSKAPLRSYGLYNTVRLSGLCTAVLGTSGEAGDSHSGWQPFDAIRHHFWIMVEDPVHPAYDPPDSLGWFTEKSTTKKNDMVFASTYGYSWIFWGVPANRPFIQRIC